MKLQKCFASLIFALTPKLFRMMAPVQAPFLLTMITLLNYHFLTEVKKLLYSHITIRDITSTVKIWINLKRYKIHIDWIITLQDITATRTKMLSFTSLSSMGQSVL